MTCKLWALRAVYADLPGSRSLPFLPFVFLFAVPSFQPDCFYILNEPIYILCQAVDRVLGSEAEVAQACSVHVHTAEG